jgi:outer membrane receptor protein involved in Fe transport
MTKLMSRYFVSLAFTLLVLTVLPCQAQGIVASPGSINEEARGTVVGVVIDVSNAQVLPKTTIEVMRTNQILSTDLDGNFTIKLAPGTYQLRFSHSGYQDHVAEKVVVRAKEVTALDIALSPERMTLGEVEVRAAAENGATEIALLAERRVAATLNDAISAREISRDTNSNAAGVLQRVVGISIVQDKFVYVRGLGERYSNTVLNDAVLPTTEPDRRTVPMDLIPGSLLDNVKVLKSFTPDQPGEFSGGLVKIQATEFPSAGTLKISTSYGFNSLTSFKDFMTYPGDRLDWLGFGTGRRALPGIIPNQRLRRGNPIVPGFTAQELQTFGRAFENIWEPRDSTARLNQSYSVSGGTTIGKLGLVGALTYSNKLQNQDENRAYYVIGAGNRLIPRSVFASEDFINRTGLEESVRGIIPEEFLSDEFLRGYQSSANTVRLGGTANVAYKLTNNHKLMLKNFYTHDGTDNTRVYRGWYESRGTILNDERLRYIEEEIYSGQISGDHLLSKLGESIVTWRLTYSRATLDEPDLRESIYEFDPALGQFRYFSQLQSGLRLFNVMGENIREPAVDWSKFFFLGKSTINLKAGASYSNRDRGFMSRRFRFVTRGLRGIDLTAPPEQLFALENIRPDGFEIFEETRPTDAYQGIHDITAGYGMVDVTLRKWRIIGGARFEQSDQQVITFDPFRRELNPIEAGQEKTDVMPSLGVVYNLTSNMNLRAGYSQTVARPQFRELSPFEFTDVTGGSSARGNPDLVRTAIWNFDARWEWFVSPQELVAVSFFYKKLKSPIEQVIEPSNELTIISYRNVQGAKNWGLELEVRKNLGFLSSRLENLSVMSNYTFVDSNVIIGQQQLNVLTSLERPLVGQAQHVFNGTVQYEIPRWNVEARALINYVGQRITEVGAFGLPDIFEDGYLGLDVFISKRFWGEAKKLELKFSGENLIDREIRFNQGPNPYWYYNRGRTFSVGVAYTIF